MRVIILFAGLQLNYAVIQGTFSDSKLVQFSVSIAYCMNQSMRSTCYSFCSGSLIAPDVVLTAGHCVNDAKLSTFKEFVPPYPVSQMSVVVGSRNPRLGDDGVLVSVKSVINAGYSRSSLLFDIDDDVGLIFLSECVQMVPGSITTAKVATLQSEPAGPNTVITLQGHGINANIPDQIRTDDSSLRYMKSSIQTYDVCINAAVYIALQLQGVDPSLLDDPLYSDLRTYYFSQFVPEKTICAGGNTWPYSSCNGDSGGGWIHSSNGLDQIIGIVSFEIDSSRTDTFCGYSPNYGTRVAFYADWIKEKIVANSLNCPGWDISQTFASTNVEPLPSSEYSQVMQDKRCTPFTQFQCYSGKCVDWEQVCDSVPNCGPFDNSDEDSAMCAGSGPVLYENIPFQHVQQPRLFDHIPIPAGIPRFDPFAELVVPVVRSVDPAIGLLTCNNLAEYMQARITAERREGLNRAEYDTSVWTELCNKFGQCALEDVYLGTFCDDWNGFLVRRNLAQSISLGFNARFGSSANAPDFPHQPPLPAFDFNSSDVIGTTVSPSDVPITSIGGPVPFDPITSSTSQRGIDPRDPFLNMFTAGVVIMAFHI
jgi:hypothetical protein